MCTKSDRAVLQLQLFFVILCTLQDRFRDQLDDAKWLLSLYNLDDTVDTNMGVWSPRTLAHTHVVSVILVVAAELVAHSMAKSHTLSGTLVPHVQV